MDEEQGQRTPTDTPRYCKLCDKEYVGVPFHSVTKEEGSKLFKWADNEVPKKMPRVCHYHWKKDDNAIRFGKKRPELNFLGRKNLPIPVNGSEGWSNPFTSAKGSLSST